MLTRTLVVFCFLLAPVFVGAQEKPLVLVSIAPQAYIVDRIAGDHVKVDVLLPKGVSAETFEPQMHQLTRAHRAKLYLMLGHPHFHFEEVWHSYLREHVPAIKIEKILSSAQQASDDDLHVWLSPALVKQMLPVIAEALSALLPTERELFAANLVKLTEEIGNLQTRLHHKLDPISGKTFLVFHPAWGYFAQEFNLRQLAIEREGKEPDPAHLANVIKEAKKLALRKILVTPQFPKASAELVAKEIGAKLVIVDDLAYDWPEMLEQVATELQN